MPTNKTLVFKKLPEAAPVVGEHVVVEDRGPFDPEQAPPSGGFSLSVLCASFDPYLRGRMRPANIKSYSPPFEVNEAITNTVIGKVLKSDANGFKSGDLVMGFLPIAEYVVVPKEVLDPSTGRAPRKVDNPHNFKELGLFLGPLGMPGLTAYSSVLEIGKPQKGETMFVSSAAGAVGQLVGQMSKELGLRVIGSVGSQEKLDYITKDLGFEGFNYRQEKPGEALQRLAPEGIDIYFENVGGEHLEAALDALKQNGRIIACGMISDYNTPREEQAGVKGLMQIISKRITMRGFIVSDEDFGPKYAQEHQEKVGKWLADGSFKAKLHETVGIDSAAEGLVGIFEGKNFGKAVLKVKDV